MNPSRRLFLGAGLAIVGAPAIVRASSLMKLWVPKPSIEDFVVCCDFPLDFGNDRDKIGLVVANRKSIRWENKLIEPFDISIVRNQLEQTFVNVTYEDFVEEMTRKIADAFSVPKGMLVRRV